MSNFWARRRFALALWCAGAGGGACIGPASDGVRERPVGNALDECVGWTAPAETLGMIQDNLEIVVDKLHGLPVNYQPSDLVSLASVLPGEAGDLRREAADGLARMFAAASSEAGHGNLMVVSSFRSFETQCATFERWVQYEMTTHGRTREEAIQVATTYSALPGKSEHQLGLAVDLSIDGLGSGVFDVDFVAEYAAGRWLSENSSRFGFVLSYPSGASDCTGYRYEAWHYRYVGVETAGAWYEARAELIPYEYLRGETCGGQPVGGRQPGGGGYQLPTSPPGPAEPANPPQPGGDPAQECAEQQMPTVSTCHGSWLLECHAQAWEHCPLGCLAAAMGDDDRCSEPDDRDADLAPAALCSRFADAGHPYGIDTCGDSRGFPGWLLVCEPPDGEPSSPGWIRCPNGCEAHPTGEPDRCAGG